MSGANQPLSFVTDSTKGRQEDSLSQLSETPSLQGPHEPNHIHVPEQSSSQKLLATDVLIVGWDGPSDPLNHKNWSYRHKWTATVIVSSFTLMSPVSSSMIVPAGDQVASTFGINSNVIMPLTTSVFVLAYVFGPLFLGPISETYGRSRVLQLSNLWFLVWNIGCGFARTESQLLAFRFLAGLGGSAPLSVAAFYVAIFSLAPLLGPVIGPITSAWIAERSNWQWVFWSTSIVDGVIQILGLCFLQETFAPLLLERKAKRIRESMDAEKTYREVYTVFEGPNRSWQTIMAKSLSRPFALFIHEPIVQLLGVYMAYVNGIMYLFLTTMPSIFQGVYHQPAGIAGLHYIALGIGMVVASQINARTMDKFYIYLKSNNGGIGFRLPAMFPGTALLPIGCLIAGWTSQAHTHWIAPDIGIALIGAGMIINYHCIQTYLVDAFTLHAASALAAISCLRSIASFGFPLFAPAMYNALGFGKGDTVLAAVAIVIGCPAPWIFWRYGERIRMKSRHARS